MEMGSGHSGSMARVIRGGIFEYTINPISESICML